ncbi:acetylornithine deacetylase [Falsiroseomonas selenitidurans]|uniref:Acetylornithine deacetylase n=1 Tax=Falsiroseomonas selenitidurans TaxID=2716335 RepID=A0ABX1E7G1_9PROT|nr:acetylornithine deacetylase [Falsiroseomonas selenitidurans]NKC32996.1 acetylornithine deacetylase [Falsiroseomonas selenitidurans]
MAAEAEAVRLLDRLVGFDTTSARSNLDLVQFVEQALASHGVTCRRVPDPGGQKAALHAVIGPAVAGGVALSAHADCVPVEGQAWQADPFVLRRAAGRLIGRGTVDMKGFWACVMAAVPGLRAKQLKRPVHLCLSFDEETTFAGAPLLVASLGETGPPPAWCIVGEPSGMAPVVAHKGYASWEVTVTGRTGHSSQTHRTANALEAAAEAVALLKQLARRYAAEGRRAEGFEPPWTTVHTGTFHAGSILNIVPDLAEFVFEVRSVPGDPAEAVRAAVEDLAQGTLLPALRATAPEAEFRIRRRCDAPPLDLPEASPLLALARACGAVGAPARVPFATEAGVFQRAGIATLVCGPGQVAQAHQPEEWIADSEIAACCAFLDRLGDRLAA